MRNLALAVGLFLICANSNPKWYALSVSKQRMALNRIADACGLPPKAFKLGRSGDVHFQPTATAKYEAVVCALDKLKSDLGYVKMGFIGNETYDSKVK